VQVGFRCGCVYEEVLLLVDSIIGDRWFEHVGIYCVFFQRDITET